MKQSAQYRLKESIWQYMRLSLFEFEKTNGYWHVSLLELDAGNRGALLRIERTVNGEWRYDALWSGLWYKEKEQ